MGPIHRCLHVLHTHTFEKTNQFGSNLRAHNDKKDEQLPGTSTSGADSHSIVVDLLEPQDDVEIECKDGAQEATTVVEETKHGSSPVVSSPVAAAVSPWAFRANSLKNSAKESTEEPTDQARTLPQMGRGGGDRFRIEIAALAAAVVAVVVDIATRATTTTNCRACAPPGGLT